MEKLINTDIWNLFSVIHIGTVTSLCKNQTAHRRRLVVQVRVRKREENSGTSILKIKTRIKTAAGP